MKQHNHNQEAKLIGTSETDLHLEFTPGGKDMLRKESANQEPAVNDSRRESMKRTKMRGDYNVVGSAKRAMIKIGDKLYPTISLTVVALVFFVMPSLALGETSMTSASPQSTSQLIQQLDAAKSADWNAALDPDVSAVRRETFLNQMNKADRAAKELRHGFAVPQAELTDALWAPPKHISPEERTQLIQELKQARRQDDQNEQNMLNDEAWSHSGAPADTTIFDEHKQQVDAVEKDLEIGAPVHWTAIKQATGVPTSPY